MTLLLLPLSIYSQNAHSSDRLILPLLIGSIFIIRSQVIPSVHDTLH